jgi:hypothetical protein
VSAQIIATIWKAVQPALGPAEQLALTTHEAIDRDGWELRVSYASSCDDRRPDAYRHADGTINGPLVHNEGVSLVSAVTALLERLIHEARFGKADTKRPPPMRERVPAPQSRTSWERLDSEVFA